MLDKIIELIKKPVRKIRKAKRAQIIKNTKREIKKAQIIADLKTLGLKEGQAVIVHSSLKAIGFVDGGPKTVVDALIEVLGPSGTLLMPAYPMNKSMYRHLSEDPLFDPVSARSNLGAITETFRHFPGVVRSLHPTHSVTALGPQAEFLTSDHEKSETPCGATSPFAKLADIGGFILAIGCGIGKVTSYHVAEDRIKDFPIPVYLREKIRARFVSYDGTEEAIDLKVHDPKFSKLRIDNQPEKEAEILALLKKEGTISEGMVGDGLSHLMDAQKLEVFLERVVSEGITIYIDSVDETDGGRKG